MGSLLLALALSLRLHNPQAVAVDTQICGAAVHLEAGDIVDLAPCSDAQLDPALIALDVLDDDQKLLASNAACDTTAMRVPAFACKGANATASVPFVEGATYSWTVEGAMILSGAGTNAIALVVHEVESATLTCVITTHACSSTATGVIAVRAPLVIRDLKASSDAETAKPVTITWSYEPGATPSSQLLSGSAFAEPIALDAATRSYTFTPDSGGTQRVELRASYARAIPSVTRARRRSVSPTPDAIALCPSARATTEFEVRGCAFKPKITAPDDVVAEGSFAASVALATGDTAQWSVVNGTITGTSDSGDRANIRAGSNGTVVVSVRVVSASSCSASAEARVPTYQKQCATPPAATLALLSQDCDRAMVRATFTGTPPFAGTWSDRKTFRTNATSIVKEFNDPGSLRLTELHDANCVGAATNDVTVATLAPTVTLEDNGSCGVGQLVAKFKGVPPFNGTWSDGVKFTTNDSQVTRTVAAGTWSVSVSDANCARPVTSKPRNVIPAPRLVLSNDNICNFGYSSLDAEFEGGEAPYVVEWKDGTTAKSLTTPRVWRTVPQTTTTLEVTRAMAGTCNATISNPFTHVTYRSQIGLNIGSSFGRACYGEPTTYRLAQPLPAGAKILWTIPGATIVSGQGSAEVTFTPYRRGDLEVSGTITYSDGICDQPVGTRPRVSDPGVFTRFTVVPMTVKRGETAQVLYFPESGVYRHEIRIPKGGYVDDYFCFPDCQTTLRVDKNAPASMDVELHYIDCAGWRKKTITITTTP